MKKILVTGGAGFIGSNLIKSLLEKGYHVICFDNLSTGFLKNIEEFKTHSSFEFIEGDILDFQTLKAASRGCSAISHQAALGSVPRSIEDPLLTNKVNIEGTLNVFKVAVDNEIEKVVYAASSSTYGDSSDLPKKEEIIGNPLSPYAVTKLVNEIYADVFYKTYQLNTIGLRYFNVFGPKQNPNGAYAAVIPLFIKAMLANEPPHINGDGLHSRDFTFVENAVAANLLALDASLDHYNTVYNVACGEQTSLLDLVAYINALIGKRISPVHRAQRVGDVKHSLADISKAKSKLGYQPNFSIEEGLKLSLDWYRELKTE